MTFLSISTFFCTNIRHKDTLFRTNIRHFTTFFCTNIFNFCSSSPKWTKNDLEQKIFLLIADCPRRVVLFFIFFRAKTCWFQFFIVTLPQTIIRQTWSTKDYHTECQTTHGLGSRTTTGQTKPCIYRRWKKQETSSTSSVHADLARAFF